MTSTLSGTKNYYSSEQQKVGFRCEGFGGCPGWIYSSSDSCGVSGHLYCAQITPTDCSTLGPVKPVNMGSGYKYHVFPVFGNCVGSFGPCPGVCYYDTDSMASSKEAILAYTNEYCKGSLSCPNQSEFDLVMRKYCSGTSTNCPAILDVYDGTIAVPKVCSLMVASDDTLCHAWSSNVQYNDSVSAVMDQACSGQRKNSSGSKVDPLPVECGCVSRAKNPLYQAAVQGAGQQTNDACWWKACQNPSSYLVTPAMTAGLLKPDVCPSVLCTQIINNANNSNSTINENNISWSISCNNSSGPTPGSTTWWKQNWVYVLIGAGIFLALLLLLILVIAGISASKRPQLPPTRPQPPPQPARQPIRK